MMFCLCKDGKITTRKETTFLAGREIISKSKNYVTRDFSVVSGTSVIIVFFLLTVMLKNCRCINN